MHSAQGFTLIELLLVAVIISTISVFSFAGFSDISKIQTLKEAALGVESDLRFAHNQAINSVRPFIACGSLVNYRLFLSSNQHGVTACDRIVKVNRFPASTSVSRFVLYMNDGTTMSANNIGIYFLPTGEVKFTIWLSRATPAAPVEAKSADIELIYGGDTTRAYIVNVQASGGTLFSKRGI